MKYTARNGVPIESIGNDLWVGLQGARLYECDVEALREYLARQPETKPWANAKDGEIWELIGANRLGQYVHEGGRFFLLPLREPISPLWKPAAFASEFDHGRRVWPSENS